MCGRCRGTGSLVSWPTESRRGWDTWWDGASDTSEAKCLATICDTIWPMARREVLVQLDDDLVDRLDSLAAELGTSRSELLRRGAQAVLDAEQLAAADRTLQIAYRRQPVDPALLRSARRLAAETSPAW